MIKRFFICLLFFTFTCNAFGDGIDADTYLYFKFAEGPDEAQDCEDYGPNDYQPSFADNAKLDSAVKLSAGGYSVDVTSLSLDGSGDYVAVGDNAHWDLFGNISNITTVEGWVYFDNAGRSEFIIDQWEDSSNSWLVQRRTDNTIQFTYETGNVKKINLNAGSATIGATTWAHVAVVVYGTGSTFQVATYVGGARDQTGSDATTDTFNANLFFGRLSTNYVDGNLSQWRIQGSDVFSAWNGSGFEATITAPTGPYSEAASGWTHTINGVVAGSMAKVNSVARASIAEINQT